MDSVIDLKDELLLREQTYTISDDEEIGNSNLNIYVENPADSGSIMLFYFGQLTHENRVRFIVHNDVSGVSGGTDGLLVNNNTVGSEKTTVADILKNVTFTGEGEHQRQVYVGSGTRDVFDGYRIIIRQGERAVFDIEDLSGNNDQVGIRLSYGQLSPDELSNSTY